MLKILEQDILVTLKLKSLVELGNEGEPSRLRRRVY